MIDQFKSIAIETGKPFQPDPKTRGFLDAAVSEAHAWLCTKYENVFSPPFYQGSH